MTLISSVYEDYTTKSVFVWICIVLMCVGWVLTVIQTKRKNMVETVKENFVNKASNILNGIKVNAGFGDLFKNYGGYIIFVGSWIALCFIEALWRPYSILGDVDDEELKKLISKNN